MIGFDSQKGRSEEDEGERELPPGWRFAPIGEVCNVNPRRSPSSAISGDLPVTFVPMAAVDADSGTIMRPEIRPFASVRKGFTAFEEGDVIVAKITPCMENGKAAVARNLENRVGFGSTEFHVLRCTEALLPEYLYHFVRQESFRREAEAHMTGTVGQKRLPAVFIANALIPVPPLPEQRQIVAALDAALAQVSAARARLTRVPEILKRYRASVLKAACEGRLVPTEADRARAEGREYEAAEQLLARILEERRAKWEEAELAKFAKSGKTLPAGWRSKYKEPEAPNITELPEGWAGSSLEAITSAARPICYGILMPKENIPGGVPYVRVKDLKDDRIDVDGLPRTSPEIAAAYARASLKPGDLLLAIRGTYGRVAEVPEGLKGANITQDTARLAISRILERSYVAIWLRSPLSQQYFERVARGVAVKGVNIADVRLLPISLPPLAEQRRTVTEVDRLLGVADAVEARVERATAQVGEVTQALLAKAFRGELLADSRVDSGSSVS